MRVLLVNPPRFHGVPVIREERCEITERYSVLPPYSLLQVASILRNLGHEINLIDANGLNKSWAELKSQMKEISYDVLIFRFAPTTFDWDLKTASISKQNHPKAVTVGICWTLHSLAEEVLRSSHNLDIYIMHEYESVTPDLITALSRGETIANVKGIAYQKGNKIYINNSAKSLTDWNSIPLPAYDLLSSLEGYFINTRHGSPFTIIYASKGCPYSCIFCTERNTQLKNRPAEDILSELRYLKKVFGVKTVSFFDETFTIDRTRIKTIAEGIAREKLGIVWYCNTRVNLVSKDLLQIMYRGGCRGISYGVESGSQIVLDNAKKGTKVEQAEQAIRWAKKTGIKVYCSFILGLPGENWSTVKETIDFVKRTLPTGAQFNVAVPYPGTELHRIALRNGWIKESFDWRQMYQHEAIMSTAELSSHDLDEARQMAYRALYFNPRWWLQNMRYVITHPNDLPLATKYVPKIMNNYVVHKMVHAH
jgi:radical SAM superfamily enzyme YgiQ (UPF0313 family)